eukprot:gene3521-2472_t
MYHTQASHKRTPATSKYSGNSQNTEKPRKTPKNPEKFPKLTAHLALPST